MPKKSQQKKGTPTDFLRQFSGAGELAVLKNRRTARTFVRGSAPIKSAQSIRPYGGWTYSLHRRLGHDGLRGE